MTRPPLAAELLFLAGAAWLAAHALDRAATGFGWTWGHTEAPTPGLPMWVVSAALALLGCALTAMIVFDLGTLFTGR